MSHLNIIGLQNGIGFANAPEGCLHRMTNHFFRCRRNPIGLVMISDRAVERIGSFADYRALGKVFKLAHKQDHPVRQMTAGLVS